MDALEEIFFVFTPEGKILEWNQRINEETGYSSEEIAGMHPTDFVPDEDTGLIQRKIAKVLEEGLARFEARFLTKEGQLIPYEFTGSLLQKNEKPLICGTGRNISERKRAKEELEASNRALAKQAKQAKKQAEQIEKKNALLELTKEVASASNETREFEEALQTAIDKVCEHTDWPLGHVYVPSDGEESAEEEPSRLVPTAIWSRGSKGQFQAFRAVTEQTTFAAGEGLIGQVFESGEPEWIENAPEEEAFRRVEAAAEAGLKGTFAFPVFLDGETRAVLEFFSEEVEGPDAELLEVMESVGMQLGRVAEREKSRQRLKSSVEQYQSLKKSAADGIIVTNSDGEIADWNRGARKIFGYKRGEILGSPIETLMPERYKGIFQRGIERVNRTGKGRYIGKTIEMEGLRKNGEEFPVEISLSSWEIYGKRCFASFIRDITERRHRENELRRNEERFRRLFEEAQEGIAITTPEGEIEAVNSAAAEIFGYSREELCSMERKELYVDPEEREKATEEMHEEGAVDGKELRFRRGDGKEIICRLSATIHREEDGTPQTFQAFFRDVTEQKKAENALRESEEKFRKLSENALVGIGMTQGGIYEYANPALAEIAGYSREELLGKPLKDLVSPEDWPMVQKLRKKQLDGERTETPNEMRIQTKSGGTRLIEVAGTRITYQGKPAIIGTIQDITERRELQRKTLRVQEEERRRLGQELHDGIASQLTGATIMLSTLTAKAEEEVTEDVQDIQEIISESAGEVRRLSRGLNPAGLSEGDLPSALEGLAANTEGADFEKDSDLPSFDGDVTTHLYRIAQEATSNAQRHGDAEQIEIRLEQEDDVLLLEVEDDGAGFDPDRGGEKGLGLRSMQHRAELLGAEFTVETSPGEGTLVRARLPI